MMPCYSKTRKIKYFLDPPPPKKKAQGYKLSRYVYTHRCLSIQSARDLDILICLFVKSTLGYTAHRYIQFGIIHN